MDLKIETHIHCNVKVCCHRLFKIATSGLDAPVASPTWIFRFNISPAFPRLAFCTYECVFIVANGVCGWMARLPEHILPLLLFTKWWNFWRIKLLSVSFIRCVVWLWMPVASGGGGWGASDLFYDASVAESHGEGRTMGRQRQIPVSPSARTQHFPIAQPRINTTDRRQPIQWQSSTTHWTNRNYVEATLFFGVPVIYPRDLKCTRICLREIN